MRWNEWIAMGCAVLGFCVVGVGDLEAQLPPVPAGATAVAQGLYGPRGLKVGPDRNLYVATSGTANPQTGGATCTPVPGGPYFGDASATILKIDPQGNVTTLATGFPSTFNVPTNSGFGVGDVAFLNGELYAVTAGGGCGHGNPTTLPNMVAKVDLATGQWAMIADMSAAVVAHPAANTEPDDFQPDGDFYSLIAARGKLYTVEPNHGQVWSVTTRGDVEMVTDISKPEGHIVPTSLVDSDGGLLVSNLGTFPIAPNSSLLMTLRPGCGGGVGYAVDDCGPGTLHISSAALPGLTTVVSMAWGPDGLLYLLELSKPQTAEDPPYFPTPGDGKVVRVRRGVAEDVITGLSVPTGMTFGPDGALYVSNWGAAPAPIGQILRYNVH